MSYVQISFTILFLLFHSVGVLFAEVDNVWSVVKLQQKLEFPEKPDFRYDMVEEEELNNAHKKLIKLMKTRFFSSFYANVEKINQAEKLCIESEQNASKMCKNDTVRAEFVTPSAGGDKGCEQIWTEVCAQFVYYREKERPYREGKKNIDISFYDQPIPSCNYTVKYYEGLDKERGDQNGYGKNHHLLAEGTYNKPMKQPQCLYDVWSKAEEVANYEIVRYCAKAYFYRGYDYDTDAKNNYQTKYTTYKREGWRLYLIHGNLACSISSNPSKDAKLLSKEFEVSLVQKRCVDPGNNKYDDFTLRYTDDNREGEFMLAGVLGSLDLKCTNLEKHQLLLQIGHYCTRDKTHETLLFDLSFEKKQVADNNVHEEDKVKVELKDKMLRMATGHKIYAIEAPQWYDYVNSHQKRDPSKEPAAKDDFKSAISAENSTEYYDEDEDDEYVLGKNGTDGEYDDPGKNGTEWEEYGIDKNGTEEEYGIGEDEDQNLAEIEKEGEEDDDDENQEEIKRLLKKA